MRNPLSFRTPGSLTQISFSSHIEKNFSSIDDIYKVVENEIYNNKDNTIFYRHSKTADSTLRINIEDSSPHNYDCKKKWYPQ